MSNFKATILKLFVALSMFAALAVDAAEAPANGVSITAFGAVGDGQTLNTAKIQAAIDALAAKGGGAVVIPKGIFLSGAIFLKPRVNLYLEEGAVLKGSTNVADYPITRTRIEGHFEDWLPALINADGCDHLRIGGAGILDGSGRPFYEAFWKAFRADPRVTNLAVKRPRLVFIEDSRDVQIDGIRFENSGFWNLHLYRCQNVLVENVHFEVPDGIKCPSTDGTDIDSCQYVTIRGCTYRVDDDCVCLKGSKGPFAMQDKDSPPVEHIRVSNCAFERGSGVVTLGSEATVVRDVVVENCKVFGRISMAKLKLRPDTSQDYEDIHYRNITLDGRGPILDVQPWWQFFDLKGQPKPKSVVSNVTLSNIKGSYGSLGIVEGNAGQTEIRNITLKNINVTLTNDSLNAVGVTNLKVKNVIVNGKKFSVTNPTTKTETVTNNALRPGS